MMSRYKEIKIGSKFNRWTVLKQLPSKRYKNGTVRMTLCKCDCGNIRKIPFSRMVRGITKSCGCYCREVTIKRNSTHKKSHLKIYGIWIAMKARCHNFRNFQYKDYGGRGITICDRWSKFENFFKDMGKRPKGKTLDRINNNGNYEPNNCRWATREEQNNNARKNIFVSVNKVQIPFSELAEMFGIKKNVLYERIFKLNWDLKRALTTKI